MSRSSALLKDLRVDPLAIIADAHPKLILIITNLHFDVAGNSMRESISNHLAGDPIDLILNHRRQSLLLAFDDHTEVWRMPVGSLSARQFMPSRLEQFRKIVPPRWFRAQVMYGGASLANAFLRGMNCLVNYLHCVVRIAEQ